VGKKGVSKGGTKFEKWKEIDKQVFTKFKEYDENLVNVHDLDLRIWALEVRILTHTFLSSAHVWLCELLHSTDVKQRESKYPKWSANSGLIKSLISAGCKRR